MTILDDLTPRTISGYAIVFAALDRVIAEGEREIARLQELLGRAESATSGETASDGATRLGLFDADGRGSRRGPDLVIPFGDEDHVRLRRAA